MAPAAAILPWLSCRCTSSVACCAHLHGGLAPRSPSSACFRRPNCDKNQLTRDVQLCPGAYWLARGVNDGSVRGRRGHHRRVGGVNDGSVLTEPCRARWVPAFCHLQVAAGGACKLGLRARQTLGVCAPAATDIAPSVRAAKTACAHVFRRNCRVLVPFACARMDMLPCYMPETSNGIMSRRSPGGGEILLPPVVAHRNSWLHGARIL